ASDSGDALFKYPITAIAGCCARAASGHDTAALPSSVMNSPRVMCCPQSEDHTLPHRCRNAALCVTSKLAVRCSRWAALCPSSANAASKIERRWEEADESPLFFRNGCGFARIGDLNHQILDRVGGARVTRNRMQRVWSFVENFAGL